MSLYPMKVQPRFIEKMWGGRRLETSMRKSLPDRALIGESWELFDFPPDVVEHSSDWISSIIANGPLAGQSLHRVVQQHADELMGDVPLLGSAGQFPILIKLLDAREDLSIQVHPDESYCRDHAGSHLKSEAWYVIEHEPGARLLKGLVPGVTREQFRQAIHEGTVESLVQSIPAKVGQCHYLPSGTLHALGAGMLVAEVQTPSDTTFRVFDFNRIDPTTAKPRQLHVEQALECIDFSGDKPPPQPRRHVAGFFTTVTSLCSSPFFKIEKVRMSEGVEETLPYDQPVVWIVLDGQAELRVDDLREPTVVARGDTVLLPATMKNAFLKTLSDCVWLEVTFPNAASANQA